MQPGEVYNVDLGQPIGHEPGFAQPAVVVSVDILNNGDELRSIDQALRFVLDL